MPTLDEGTFALTGLALVVVLIQLIVMNRQTALAREQTALAGRQLDIVLKQEEIVARRADLEMTMTTAADPTSITFLFWAKNKGRRGAPRCYWHLWIPDAIIGNGMMTGVEGREFVSQGVGVFEGLRYRHYAHKLDDPIYPTRSVPVSKIGILRTHLTEPRKFLWIIVADDGSYPTQGEAADDPGVLTYEPS